MLDSRTPGYDQVGTVWLPLPHWVMLPFVRYDGLWRNGIAGAIPAALAFILAGSFLFAAAHRIFESVPAAGAATALFALNPNVLYLQSIPMTESLFSACLMALLYFSVRFRQTGSQTGGWGAATGAGLATCAATLTRYDGWFLLPFAAAWFLFTAKRRIGVTVLFCALAGVGPLFCLFHHWWLTGDALAFYRGPYSPRAIQGNPTYPGYHNWGVAWLYYRSAAQLCAGPVLPLLALAGALAALARRTFWPLLLLALPGIFYIWSMHSSGGTPIHLPSLPPYSWYNSRYGLAVLPLFALAAAALVAMLPLRARAPLAAVLVAAATIPWLLHPTPARWITWEESRVNSETRRAWTREVAAYLAPRYVRGSGILTGFGDITGVYREMGIPLRDTFTPDNGLPFEAATTRPDLFLHETWAVVTGGSQAQSAINRAGRYRIYYTLEKTVMMKDAPVIEIYRR